MRNARAPYDERESMSADERAASALESLKQVVAAADRSEEFQARMKAAGMSASDIRTWEDWQAIPPFSKKDLIGFQQEKGLAAMLAENIGELSRIYMSPGPIFDPEGRGADYWGWTAGFHAAGFEKGDLVQMTFGYHLTPAGLMLEEPLRELGCAVIPAGPGNTDVQMQLMTQLPVTGFVGMASYLKVIRDKAVDKGFDPQKDFSLDVAFVAAERLPESLRKELEESFDMRVRQGYGTADVGCAAFECLELTGMHLSPRCHVEICEPGTGRPLPVGEAGEVVITPFTTSYPLVRLATGDLSRLVDDHCACGRTTPRLAGILGRVDLTAKVKGQFIYPHQAAKVMAAFASIDCWQIVVDNPDGKDRLTVRLKLNDNLDVEAFSRAFQEEMKLRPIVEPVPAEECPPEDAPPLVDNRTWD